MISHVVRGDDRFTLCCKEGTDTLSINFRDIFSFDKEGRFISAMTDGSHYYRGMDNRMVRIIEPDVPGRSLSAHTLLDLSPEEAEQVLRHVHRQIERVQHDKDFRSVVARALSLTYGRLTEDAMRFRSVFGIIPMLPPDRYRSLVLKATVGCAYNRCSFCTLYDGVDFRMRSPGEFEQHIREVKEYMGTGIQRWSSIFVGDANALTVPQNDLLAIMELTHRELPDLSRHGITCFADSFGSVPRRDTEYMQLKRQGLKRVYVGLETASQEILDQVQKPTTPDEVGRFIQILKSADINVGITVLIGVGGEEYNMEHTTNTIEFINSLNLGTDDYIYLSPLVAPSSSPYDRDMLREGIRPLGPQKLLEQFETFKNFIHRGEDGYPKVAAYDVTRFIY